jgi:hypothetical protein
VNITRYLVFETYTSAANCILTLKAREPGILSPEDWFEVAAMYKQPKGELIGEPVETDWVLTYLEKTLEK